jgi:hypothetical protein
VREHGAEQKGVAMLQKELDDSIHIEMGPQRSVD